MKRINLIQAITQCYKWYEKNVAKIVFIILLHLFSTYLTQLPYINIFTGKYFPFVLDWIVFIILFSPSKRLILRIGLFCFLLNIIFAVLRIKPVVELIGEISYFAIATFVILSLKDLKKNR